jgi:hypothetical protein
VGSDRILVPTHGPQSFILDGLVDRMKGVLFMTRGLRRAFLPVLAVGSWWGCQSSTAPFDTVASNALESQVSAAPMEVASGSSVTLRVETTNHRRTTISASSGCAPGLGFQIKRPDGWLVNPYAGLAFTCPRLDSQDLEPGETDFVTWQWTAPMPGQYKVIGGLLVDGKIVGPSAPIVFHVR